MMFGFASTAAASVRGPAARRIVRAAAESRVAMVIVPDSGVGWTCTIILDRGPAHPLHPGVGALAPGLCRPDRYHPQEPAARRGQGKAVACSLWCSRTPPMQRFRLAAQLALVLCAA